MMRMANQGEWRPALEFLGEAIARQTGIRDYIASEKVLQGFLAAYLSVTDFYTPDVVPVGPSSLCRRAGNVGGPSRRRDPQR